MNSIGPGSNNNGNDSGSVNTTGIDGVKSVSDVGISIAAMLPSLGDKTASTSTGTNSDKSESVTLTPKEIHDWETIKITIKITIRIKIMFLNLLFVVS